MAVIYIITTECPKFASVQKSLTQRGYTVIGITTSEIFQTLNDQSVTETLLVVTPIFMDSMDGLEVTNLIMSYNPQAQVIAVLNSDDPRNERYLKVAKQVGATDTVRLSENYEEISQTIEKWAKRG